MFRGVRFRHDCASLTADSRVNQYFTELSADMTAKIAEDSYAAHLGWWRDSLSNMVQLRGPVLVAEPASESLLNRLAAEHLGG